MMTSVDKRLQRLERIVVLLADKDKGLRVEPEVVAALHQLIDEIRDDLTARPVNSDWVA